MLTDKVSLWSAWRPWIRLWCNPLPCYNFRPLEKQDVPMTFTVILLNLQHSLKKLECSHHGGVCRYFCFLISSFISIKDTYSLALAGEHMLSLSPIIVSSFRKDFDICKDRLFSASCLKDARIWNEALGNNFKEAHGVFVFIFFPLQSHMKTYPEAPLEQVLLLNPIAGAIIHIRWMDFEKFPKTQNNCLIDSFPKAILAIGYIYCFAFAWCSLEGLCMELLWYLGPCDIVQPYLPLSRVRTFPTIDFCLPCVDSERWM